MAHITRPTIKAAKTTHIDPAKMYTMPEAAAILSLSRQTILREIKRRHIPVQVVDRPETMSKKGYRTIRIQGVALASLMNALEKSL